VLVVSGSITQAAQLQDDMNGINTPGAMLIIQPISQIHPG
jgi:hypothetical protein